MAKRKISPLFLGLAGIPAALAAAIPTSQLLQTSSRNGAVITVELPPVEESFSRYGDISLSDWNWARRQAIEESLRHKAARDDFREVHGANANFDWSRENPLIQHAVLRNQLRSERLLIIDLGHYDFTERANIPASGAQASNGMTEAEFVDVQGRALYAEAKRQGYNVVFIRAPDEAMRVNEFNDFSIDDRKSYYARVRGAQIDYIAHRMGFTAENTRAVTLHMDRSRAFENEDPERVRGTAVHVNARHQSSIEFARAIASRIPDNLIAPYVRHNDGIEYTTILALPKAAENIPTILLEYEFMSDHPQSIQRRRALLNDQGASWARGFMNAIGHSFGPRPLSGQTRIAYNDSNYSL